MPSASLVLSGYRRRRRARLLGVGVVAVVLLAPAPARAATLDVSDGVLRYAGAAGMQTRLQMDQSGPARIRVTRQPGYGDTDSISTGAGCVATVNPNEYDCAGVARVDVNLGDELDGVGVYGLTSIPASLHGGPGDDYLSGGRTADVLRGDAGDDYLYAGDGGNDVDGGEGDDEIFSDTGTDVLRGGDGFDSVEFSRTEDPAPQFSITLDGAANDGAAGENDLIAADIEDVKSGTADYAGNPGTVSLTGNAGTNVLRVEYGRGTLAGGGGNDFLTGGPHDDVIDARDGSADRISCGDGSDRALVDAVDSVGSGCESLERLPEPTTAADDAPPAISMSAPTVAATLRVGRAEILAARATDDRGIAKVQFMLGERVLCEDTSAPYTCAYTPTSRDAGRQTIVAVVIDTRQQTAVALRSVDVRGASVTSGVRLPAKALTFAAGARTIEVPVECVTEDGAACTGTLWIEALVSASTPRQARAARRGRRVTIARARLSVASGQRTTIKARISRRGVKRVLPRSGVHAKRRTVSARMTVALVGSRGERLVTRRTTTLTVSAEARR